MHELHDFFVDFPHGPPIIVIELNDFVEAQ